MVSGKHRDPVGLTRSHRLVLALYPRHWRDRYGEEFIGLVSDRPLAVLYVVIMNTMFFKGQSWRARFVLSGLLIAIGGLAVWIARLI